MIKKELTFIGFLDFCNKRKNIKEEYKILKFQDKVIYKLYVYSIPFEKEYIKDIMWQYLNTNEESIFFECELMAEYYRRIDKGGIE